ncbi:hypothetical protein [Hoeflea sp. TYP-13]|uniref:hypothetical protein n=1 Tax=Hoeflea sp. TYP-13 TaxID=3230023 RepID=UPI0034C645EA
MHHYRYSLALWAGFAVYAAQLLIFVFRFGALDLAPALQGLIFIPVGWLMFIPVVFFMNRLETSRQQYWLWGFVIVALPVSLLGMAMGGLFGTVGVFIYGVLPVALASLIGFFIIRLLSGKQPT